MNIILAILLSSSIQCGLKPLAPLGCSSEDAVCMCDADGNCEWVFMCDNNG